ncbi:hypothetical protein [Streptomyces sp. NBC_01233]|nr:hypothetical protein OG332_18600 [Streptomyces sp. NBC_01233]
MSATAVPTTTVAPTIATATAAVPASPPPAFAARAASVEGRSLLVL